MPHLMIDCYGTNESKLSDLKYVNDVLDNLTFTLKFKAVMPPFLLPYYYAEDAEDDGISAFVLLQGGHITIHTFPQRECYFVDVLCENYFDTAKVLKLLNYYLPCRKEKHMRAERKFIDPLLDAVSIDAVKGSHDFGPHVLARIADPSDVSLEGLYDILEKLPGDIRMQAISRPYVIKSGTEEPRYLSGIVLIAQSHIAFHYNMAEKVLYFDLFSCSYFDVNQLAEIVSRLFSGKVEYQLILRGNEHDKKKMTRAGVIDKRGMWKKNIADKGERG